MSVRFDSARLKVTRAERHIGELRALIIDFAGQKPCTLMIQRNEDRKSNSLVASAAKGLPEEVAMAIGDVIHNLRTSLDHMAFQIVGDSRSKVQFPMNKTASGLVSTPPFNMLTKAFPAMKPLLLNKLRPYEDGNYPLWALDQMDIIDKHKLLLPAYSVSSITGLDCVTEDGEIKVSNLSVFVEEGLSASLIGTDTPLTITNPGIQSVAIKFSAGSYFEGQDVFGTLNLLVRTALYAIVETERVYFGVKK